MKNILKIAGLAAALCATRLYGQDIQYLLNNGVVPIGASNVFKAASHRGSNVVIQTAFQLTGAGTAGVAFVLEASNDYATWSSTPHQFWRAANGATEVKHATNFNIGGAPFLRITCHNTNSLALTNSTITLHNKPDFAK